MKTYFSRRFYLTSLAAALTYASVCAMSAALTLAAESGVTLVSPAQNAEVSVAPAAVLEYQSADARGWDKDYDPTSVKHGVEECSHPTPVKLEWTGGEAPYTLELSQNADFTDAKVYETTEPTVDADNLNPGTVYYWRVKSSNDEKASEARSFSTQKKYPRWFNIPGPSNVRDIGGQSAGNGKRIKQGMVFRGTQLDGHFAIQEDGKRYMLDEMKIRTDFDLRGPSEWGNIPDYSSPLGPTVQWLNFRVSCYGGIFEDDQKELYRQMFHTLADKSTYPVYIHCWAGADRTGTLCMALEAILGVGDSDLIADYEATSFSTIGKRWLGSDSMQSLLNGVSKYGAEGDPLSVKFEKYLLSIGIPSEELDAIRGMLLENE